jgi:hypothetical protein
MHFARVDVNKYGGIQQKSKPSETPLERQQNTKNGECSKQQCRVEVIRGKLHISKKSGLLVG